tara:strand:- start:21990 stop:23126 length:1137 start_codon:yes stop_codon:yes gene_type:complete
MATRKSIKLDSINNAKRIVLKVGSSLLINSKSGKINTSWIKSLAENISFLISNKKEILIVSSGAIALGKNELRLKNKSLKLNEKQAAAAAGQIVLAKAWKNTFEKLNINCGQILVSHSDLEIRKNAMNTRTTLNTLIELNTIPIINENDTVATREIRYGDNDQLAARIAHLLEADVLILLSDIDGLYSKDPYSNKNAKFISKVNFITKEIENMGKNTKSNISSGGMITKIKAAKIATAGGCNLIISDGQKVNSLMKLINGGNHTIFRANLSPKSARKKWILSKRNRLKFIIIDDGAKNALNSGKSLLSAGIIKASNNFKRGETVNIISKSKKILGCGIIGYNSKEINIISGKQSKNIEKLIGYKGRDEAIHRDDMVID